MKRRVVWRRVRKVAAWAGSVALLVLLALYLTGTLGDRVTPGASAAPVRDAQGETVFKVARVERELIERSPGTVRAIRETAVTSRIVAEVREVLVRAGARVQRGDPLVLLDDRDLQAMLQQRQRELSGAEARLSEAEATYNRTKTAADQDAVSQSILEQAEAARLGAEADVARLGQRVEESRIDLSHATVRAPFDAVITDRYVYPGELASPQRPLLRLYDPGEMRLEAYVRESLAIHLEVAQQVTVELDTLGVELEGRVEEVVPHADAASRAFLVKVGLPPMEKLYPGMFGRLLLRSGRTGSLLVPGRALTHVGQLSYVTLADAERTRRLVIPGGYAREGQVEIQSGVEEGLEIVVPR